MRSILCLCLFALTAWATTALAYDPMQLPTGKLPSPVDLTVHDSERNRDVPVRIYLPVSSAPAPVVLFSHGLGGSREGSPFLGEHWAARGYAVVYLQHAGSDGAVWKDVSPAERMVALKGAASLRNYLLRLRDVPVVLDQLTAWNKEAGHALAGRLDLDHVGMSGHSFGAMTTQGVSGESFPAGVGKRFTDSRIRAAVAFSPDAPSKGDPQAAFSSVAIPWMLMTGTKDVAFVGSATVESREAVYPALPPGDKYEVVLENAEHSAFSDRPLPGDRQPRNPNHHRVILALSTAFWDAYLKGDAEAKSWLAGDGPRQLMEQGDRWQRK